MRLKRTLSLFDATALGIGAIIGAGIFVILGVASGLAGPAIILSIILAGIVASFTAVSYGKLSSTYPKEGSVYVFGKYAISPRVGFIAGWFWLFENIIAGVTVSIGLGSYIHTLFPVIPIVAAAAGGPFFLTILNLVGIKQSSIFNALLVILKVSALALFVIIGFAHLNFNFYYPFAPKGLKGILNGAALIFFAFIGFGRPTTTAEEIKNPRRTVPLSVGLALGISFLTYLLVGFTLVGLEPYQQLANSGSPLADAIDYGIKIYWLKVFISFAAIAATLSVLLTTLIGVSRVTFAMARDGYLPKYLSKVHWKYGTPYRAVLITGLFMSFLPLVVNISQSANITNFCSLLVYALVNLSAIFMWKKSKKKHEKLFLFISLLGLISCVILMFFLSWLSWLVGIIWLLIGLFYYRTYVKTFLKRIR